MTTALAELMGTAPIDGDGVDRLLAGARGRIIDVDQHEVVPAHLWAEVFGEPNRALADMVLEVFPEAVRIFDARIERDDAPPSRDSWQKLGAAPSAIDLTRRIEVMDHFGIDRALVFPSGPGILALNLNPAMADDVAAFLGVPELGAVLAQSGLEEIGQAVCTSYNDWCLDIAWISPRVRPVAVVPTVSMDFAFAEARRVIAAGIRAVMIPVTIPPGGLTPGHPDLDPFWELFAAADVSVLLHVGQVGLLKNTTWAQHPAFAHNPTALEIEIPVDPYSLSVAHFAPENFLAAMILGGAFERHPALRLGIIELRAGWVTPLVDTLNAYAQILSSRASKLTLTPTEYLQRNVRVSPFSWEPVDRYMSDPALCDVYCFGSDYPHFEGGMDPIARNASKLASLDPVLAEKYFVSNADLLLPA